MNLPVDFQRPVVRTFKSRRDDFKVDGSLVDRVKKMGAKAGCSFVTTMLAAFEVLLHHVTGQDDIVLGLPAAGQSANGSDNLIGHCVNLLPLRSFPVDNITFDEYLKTRKKAIFDAYDRQQFTFGSLLKKLPLSRDRSRVPLVPVIFNIDTAMNNGVFFEGLKHKLISNPRAFETFEIFLNVTGSEDALFLEWSYNIQLFSPATISGMMEKFEKILRTVVQYPTVKIGDLNVVSEAHAVFEYPGNNSAFEYPRITLHDLIRQQCLKNPSSPAITSGSKVFNYKQLESISNQFACQLSEAGIKTGDVVGLAIERSPYIIISMLAILKTGAAYVPLDPEYPKDRVSYMLEDSGAKLLLTSGRYQGQFNMEIKELLVEDLIKKCPEFPVAFSRSGVSEDDLAYVLYTSGSTGKPKGVQITHRNLVNFLSSIRELLKVNATDRILGLTTVSFDISGLEFYLPLTAGASVEIVSTETARDGYALLNLIKVLRPDFVQATPATWAMLLEAGWKEDIKIGNICSGGEPLSRELAEKLILRSSHLYNGYGPTETTIYSTLKLVTAEDKVITIGKPIGNTRVHILNPDGRAVRENEQGEIYIAGDGVAKGYLNRDTLNKERFLSDLFSKTPGAKMYRTGDLGKFLPNGDIQCLGRIDEQIKVRGYRIEPGEIEYCLSKLSSVSQSVVVSREDSPGDQRLVAYVMLSPHVNEDIDHLIGQWKQAIKNFMPAYMCPGDFVILDKIPMTPNGKVDKKGLPKPHHTKKTNGDIIGLLTPSEKILSDIWSKILGIKQPDIHDDFFESGGHSLIAMKMMAMIEKETGIQLPLSVLFECPTIALLAPKLESQNQEKTFDSLVTIKKGRNKMPLY
ncbi:MAG TPA: amino acid adenylation domain-containing protein, partial [Flavitalea sp.]|nr:amino acid adenylation domain-containing protein [Flavitalea sp.]